jgi:hypothetical protein
MPQAGFLPQNLFQLKVHYGPSGQTSHAARCTGWPAPIASAPGDQARERGRSQRFFLLRFWAMRLAQEKGQDIEAIEEYCAFSGPLEPRDIDRLEAEIESGRLYDGMPPHYHRAASPGRPDLFLKSARAPAPEFQCRFCTRHRLHCVQDRHSHCFDAATEISASRGLTAISFPFQLAPTAASDVTHTAWTKSWSQRPQLYARIELAILRLLPAASQPANRFRPAFRTFPKMPPE